MLRDSSNRGVFKEYYSLNLLTLKTSLENLIQTGDDFTVPGPDRVRIDDLDLLYIEYFSFEAKTYL